jgi:type IV fimbrial biogenesis protein FimT
MQPTARGFTLIELMTAILVLGNLFAMALPSYREVTRNNRTTAAQNDLVTAFALARSESIRRSTTVSVCASSTGTSCTGGTDWAVGWIAFTDAATAGTVDGGDEILQKWPALTGDTLLAGSAAFMGWAATGMVTPATGQTFDVYSSGCSGAKLKRVAVAPIGSVTATKQNCPP